MPQIRFSPRETDDDSPVNRASVSGPGVSVPASSSGYTPSNIAFPSASEPDRSNPNRAVAHWSVGMGRHAGTRSALNASVVAAVLSLLPGGVIVGPIAAGFLCVVLYRRRSGGHELSRGAGFKLGMLCGGLGFALFAALAGATAYLNPEKFRTAMLEIVRRAQAGYPPQQAQSLDYFTTPQGIVIFVILCLVITCIMFILLAGLGGAISVSVGRRKNR